MNLFAIAYPEMSEKADVIIESFREDYDSQHKLIKAHFSFVFPVAGFSIKDFTGEIKKLLKGGHRIIFSTHLATIHKDELRETYDAFLIPFHGHDQMIKLHEKLYSGKLSVHHLQDSKFVPHITLGSSTNKNSCLKIVEEWNEKNIIIKGFVASIDILKFDNEIVTAIERIKLN